MNNHSDILATIDHTLLKPDASANDITRLCSEATQHGFCSVCINPYFVAQAFDQLQNTDVKVCTVVGFPLGANTSSSKAYEAANAIEQGATEIDMVLNIGAAKMANYDFVMQDIKSVIASSAQAVVKVILETHFFTDDELIHISKVVAGTGAHFLKTSTGFTGGGADDRQIKLMRRAAGPDIGIKASGGVRDLEAVQRMLAAGATRIGTSSGVAIAQELYSECFTSE